MRILNTHIAGGLALAVTCVGCSTAPAGSDCTEPVEVRSLLRLDCRGRVVSGFARARVDGSVVVLELIDGPETATVLSAWPPVDAPPWLGHGPVEITPQTGRRIRLEFPGPGDPPLRLLADRRLAPWAWPGPHTGDARDRVDRGEEAIVTYDERTVGYARSLDRPARREAFDRRYYLVLAEPAEPELLDDVASRMGREWAGASPLAARRPVEERAEAPEGCWPVPIPPRRQVGGDSDLRFTVRYPAADPAARDLAERLVSASLPGRTPDLGLAGLRVRADETGQIAPSDVASVLPVLVGDVHPCSIQGEVQAETNRLTGSPDAVWRAVPLGESARFRIDPRGSV